MNLQPLASSLRSIGRETARIVLPASCVGCGQELPWLERKASCCERCWRSLPRLSSSRCRRCSLPFAFAPGDSNPCCIPCGSGEHLVDWIGAWGEYGGRLERILHAFKFDGHDFLARPLALLLHEALEGRSVESFDALVPVPMHSSKLRRRGYNQAELLAGELALLTGIPHRPALLHKKVERPPQSTLPRGARAANVRRTFEASPPVAELSVLLVDDICTTGATLESCASALLREGAARVCAVTLARA